jgi:phytoene synthase
MSSEATAAAAIRQGSKTFALAGLFFSRREWIAATEIYHWCRHCDNAVDGGGGGPATVSELRRETIEALDGSAAAPAPAFRSLAAVADRHGIPSYYPLELLNGMEMDATGTTYKTLRELEFYCYRVASTVGLMLCYVMGLFRIEALEKAAHLGMALQLTNIARDVQEDFEHGRRYLPLEDLQAERVDPEALWADGGALYRVVLRLLDRAETHYEIGLDGTRDLPFRAAFVITLAALFYRQIGVKIRRRGPAALYGRTVVTFPEKLLLMLRALLLVLRSLPDRFHRWAAPVPITQLWCPYE